MHRMLNRIVVLVVASVVLSFSPGCSRGGNNSPPAATGDPAEGLMDEDPTVIPDPEGSIPAALAASDLSGPPAGDPMPVDEDAAPFTWKITTSPETIQALIDLEHAADLTPAEIAALDLLYKNTPTPPDPGQL